jgi:hypothetical protein
MPPIVATLTSALLLAAFSARHFSGARSALVCAALYLSMPVVWVSMRGEAPQVVLAPFVAAWLLAVDQYWRSRHARWLGLAGAIPAAMCYMHRAGPLMAAGGGVLRHYGRGSRQRPRPPLEARHGRAQRRFRGDSRAMADFVVARPGGDRRFDHRLRAV